MKANWAGNKQQKRKFKEIKSNKKNNRMKSRFKIKISWL